MNTFYLDEHLACHNYISDLNIGFTHYHISKGEYYVSSHANNHYLFFFVKGDSTLSFESQEYDVKENTIGFFPIASKYKIYAKTDVEVIVHYFDKPIDLYEQAALEKLTPYVNKESYTPVMKLKLPLKTFLNSLLFYLNNSVSGEHYYELKQKELFFILLRFYTKEEVAALFAPIICQNLDFRNVILKNYMNVQSVKELARICNHSLSSFNRKFKINFNESPYKWMQNKRLKYIVKELENKDISLGEIIDEFKFSSPAHFTFYCKKHLNVTPSQFRKQHCSREINELNSSYF
jgi:AraC-like DNA-binding protein